MITLEQVKEKLEDLKSEIRCSLKCEPEDLEIVQHESECISIDWKEKRASMFADPSDFMDKEIRTCVK